MSAPKTKQTVHRTPTKPSAPVKKRSLTPNKKTSAGRTGYSQARGYEPKRIIVTLSACAVVLVLGCTGYALYQHFSASASSSTTSSTSLTSVVDNLGSKSSLVLSSGNYTLSNFSDSLGGTYDGVLIPTSLQSFTGAGIDKSVIKMNTNSSTQSSKVPTASGTTNQLFLIYFRTGTTSIGNFTLAGSTQGHLYNGMMLNTISSPKITNVKVTSVPGSSNSPPGETFGIDDFKTTNAVYDNVEVNGSSVGASGLGVNNSSNVTINNSYFHGNSHAMGVTFWKTAGASLTNVRSMSNSTAFNFEMDTGTFTLKSPTFGSSSSGHDINIGSDSASIKLTIHDPTISNGQSKIRINLPSKYHGATNSQKKSDIHVYVGSSDKTSSLVQWLP